MELQALSRYRHFERGQGKLFRILQNVLAKPLPEQYTATATAKGAGRSGHVECDGLKFNLAVPKEMGGTGKGENPEQLFAMGYSSLLIIYSYMPLTIVSLTCSFILCCWFQVAFLGRFRHLLNALENPRWRKMPLSVLAFT